MNDNHDNHDNHASRERFEEHRDGSPRQADASARKSVPSPEVSGGSNLAGCGDEFPPLAGSELADLVRDLDRIGAMRRRELSSSLEERIFAASDLQLPMTGASAGPVIARIDPHGTFISRNWMRIAAGIAVVASITAGAVVLSRSVGSSGDVDRAAPGSGRVVAEAPDANRSNPSASDAVRDMAVRGAAPAAEHFDLALTIPPPQRASSMSSTVVASALDAPRRLAYPAMSGAQSGVAGTVAMGSVRASRAQVPAVASGSVVAPASGAAYSIDHDFDAFDAVAGGGSDHLQEAIDLDFDGLSGEFAAIVSRSASAN